MTALVRSASLLGYEALCRRLALDAPSHLARFGIPAQALRDPDLLISYQSFIDLLEYSADEGRCPDFGLQLAQRQGISILGPIAVLLRHAGTLGDAFTLAARYIFVHSPALQLRLDPVEGHPELVDLVFDISSANLPARPQVTTLSLGIICEAVRSLSEGRVKPLWVLLPHLPVAKKEQYRAAYGCPVRFGEPVAAVRLSTRHMNLPISEHDPQVKALALGYLAQFGSSPQAPLTTQVRSLVKNFLGSEQVSQAVIAQALSMHPRTLQRRLGAEGAVFEQIVDDMRKELFVQLIRQKPGPSITQIAYILGYAEVSVLTRSSKRWFDRTPRQLRSDSER